MRKEKWLFDNIMLLYLDLGKDYILVLKYDHFSIDIFSKDNYFEVWLKTDIPLLKFKIEINHSFFKEPDYRFETIKVIKKGLDKPPLEFAYESIKPIVREYKLDKILK